MVKKWAPALFQPVKADEGYHTVISQPSAESKDSRWLLMERNLPRLRRSWSYNLCHRTHTLFYLLSWIEVQLLQPRQAACRSSIKG